MEKLWGVGVAIAFLIVVRGVGFFLSKKLKENVEFSSQDNSCGILRSTLLNFDFQNI